MLFKSIFLFGAMQAALTTAAAMPDVDSNTEFSRDVSNPIEDFLQNHTPQELMETLRAGKDKVTRDIISDSTKVLPNTETTTATLIASLVKNLTVEKITLLIKGMKPTDVIEMVGKIRNMLSPKRAVMPDIANAKIIMGDNDTLKTIAGLLKNLRVDQISSLLKGVDAGDLNALLSKVKFASVKREAGLDLTNIASVLPRDTAPVALESIFKSLNDQQIGLLVNAVKITPQSTIESFLQNPKVGALTAVLGNESNIVTLVQNFLKLVHPEKLNGLISKAKTSSVADMEAFVKNSKLEDLQTLLGTGSVKKRSVSFSA